MIHTVLRIEWTQVNWFLLPSDPDPHHFPFIYDIIKKLESCNRETDIDSMIRVGVFKCCQAKGQHLDHGDVYIPFVVKSLILGSLTNTYSDCIFKILILLA